MSNIIHIPKEVFENIFFAEGGTKKEVVKELTGSYEMPLPSSKEHLANAEIEKNEYLLDSEGLRKAEGKTHEKGGTPVTLKEGTKIISDHLKIGVDFARELTKSLKLPFKATDTYAKAMDRYSNSVGVNKINDELEGLITKMSEQKEKSKDKETLALNNQFLNNAIYSKNKEKEPLEKQRTDFFNTLFQKQEQSKKEQSGYKMQMGGDYLGLAAKHNIDPERAKELLKSLPHFQNAGEYTEKDRRNRFKDFVSSARAAGYDGDVDMNAKDLDAEAGKLQAWMVKNKPEEVIKYFRESGQPLTAKHVDMLKKNAPWVFENTGISPKKESASYTKEEKDKLKQYYPLGETGDPKDFVKDEDYNKFLLEGFNDNKWDWRFPMSSLSTPKVPGYDAPKINAPLYKAPNNIVPQTPVEDNNKPNTPGVAPVLSTTDNKSNRAGLMLLPDQTPMFPASIQPNLKIQRRFSRVGYNDISPEEQLAEMNRSETAVQDQLKDLSPEQRAAALVGLNANANMQSNKVIADVNRANSAGRNAVDTYNAKISDAEENAAGQDALSYEQRTQTAQGNYDKELNSFYNRLGENQMNNWKTIETTNRYNTLNPDVQFTGNGYTVNKTPQFSEGETKFLSDYYNQAEASKTKNTKKKKFGGRFKK